MAVNQTCLVVPCVVVEKRRVLVAIPTFGINGNTETRQDNGTCNPIFPHLPSTQPATKQMETPVRPPTEWDTLDGQGITKDMEQPAQAKGGESVVEIPDEQAKQHPKQPVNDVMCHCPVADTAAYSFGQPLQPIGGGGA